MSNSYQIKDQAKGHFLTFQVIDWVDIFTMPAYKELITDSFDYCRKNKGLELFAYVIMTNHIHLIADAKEGFILSDIVRDFKKFTSNNLLDMISLPSESRSSWMLKRFEFAAKSHKRNSDYQLWTHENHAVELYSQRFIRQKMDYIHLNPVRAGIVEKPEDYLFSSARNYANLPVKLEIDLWI